MGRNHGFPEGRGKKKKLIIIIEDQEGAGEAERESGAGEGASEAGAVGTPAGCEAFRRRGRNPRRAGGSRGKGGGAAPGRQPRPSVRRAGRCRSLTCAPPARRRRRQGPVPRGGSLPLPAMLGWR